MITLESQRVDEQKLVSQKGVFFAQQPLTAPTLTQLQHMAGGLQSKKRCGARVKKNTTSSPGLRVDLSL